MNPDLLARVGQLAFGEWNDHVVNLLQFGIAATALVVVTWGYWLQRTNRAHLKRLEHRLLLALGLAAGLAYFNFGQFHFGRVIHMWDTYHYYVGAKYFPELGYDRLYHCAIVADAEDARTPAEAKEIDERVIRDLRTNVIVAARDVLKYPGACKQRFTEGRWQEFKGDVRFFRSRVPTSIWRDIHKDHGFNATPVWTSLGRSLANTGPATIQQITLLWCLDPVYLALTALIVWWAFGPGALAVGLIMLGTNYPNRYYWTGGAYLRYDWLFYLVAVVCLLKRKKFSLAGAALAYSTLLRLFPGFLLLGPLAAGIELYRRRGGVTTSGAQARFKDRIDPDFVRFVAGGAAATVVLVLLSVVFLGGAGTWGRFADNTVKHAATPLLNHMGLPTILSYRPADTAAHTFDATLMDRSSKWREKRRANGNQLEPAFWLAMIACCMSIYLAVRQTRGELWVSAALGAGMIAFAGELTCYYYCFLVAMAPLNEKRREVGIALIALAAATQLIALTGITGQNEDVVNEDVVYVAMSVLTLLAIAGIWWMIAARTQPRSYG